jgi:hypothetical protein
MKGKQLWRTHGKLLAVLAYRVAVLVLLALLAAVPTTHAQVLAFCELLWNSRLDTEPLPWASLVWLQ